MLKNIRYLLALPKSILFCLRVFPLKTAINIPILISNNTKVFGCVKGSIELKNKVSFAQVRIGFWDGAGRFAYHSKTVLNIDKGATCIFGKNICLAKGSLLRVIEGGRLIISDNYAGNYNVKIICRKTITFGENCLCGWNTTFTDGDGHKLFVDNQFVNHDADVIIGNNCWICAESTLLKGAKIPSNAVVGYGTIVNNEFEEEGTLIVGIPAKIVRKNIRWIQ